MHWTSYRVSTRMSRLSATSPPCAGWVPFGPVVDSVAALHLLSDPLQLFVEREQRRVADQCSRKRHRVREP